MARYKVLKAKGIKFFLAFDAVAPDLLHIYARHLTGAKEAIETFFAGEPTWNDQHERLETYSESHVLYWFWLEENTRVMVISCFRR